MLKSNRQKLSGLVLTLLLVTMTIVGCNDAPPLEVLRPTLPPMSTPLLLPTVPTAPTAAPLPPTPLPPYSFVVVGDTWKDTPILRRVVADVRATGDAFIIVLGDVTPQGYTAQMAEFDAVIKQAGVLVYLAPGNHDYLNDGVAAITQFYPLHTSFDYGAAHFTVMDTGNYALPDGELAWLAADLAATNQPLKFVFSHIPPEAPYNLSLGQDKLLPDAQAKPLRAALAQYHVSMMFSGHLQAYVSYMGEGNVPHIISGGGGSPPHLPRILGGYYHYVRVTVQGSSFSTQVVQIE